VYGYCGGCVSIVDCEYGLVGRETKSLVFDSLAYSFLNGGRIMITLHEAVEQLNEMDIISIRRILVKYPNESGNGGKWRCLSCPVATYLRERVGSPIWVGVDGCVRELAEEGTTPSYCEPEYQLDSDIITLIRDLDQMAER